MQPRRDKRLLVPIDPLLVEVAVGEVLVAEHPQRLVTAALGSCVGVAVWDVSARRGALAHVMLPSPAAGAGSEAYGRFASTAVPLMVSLLTSAGSPARRLQAKIAGGAAMFHGDAAFANIGGRNIAEVKRQLALMSVPVVAEDTGGGHARTIELLLDTGVLLVRSYKFGAREL